MGSSGTRNSNASDAVAICLSLLLLLRAICCDYCAREGKAEEQMQKLNGVFDNRETMQREVWIDGAIAGRWHAAMCATYLGVDTLMPWQRRALEQPWGFYPNSPMARDRVH